MAVLQIRESPDLRVVCRPVPPTDDLDLVLAESAALLLWAEEHGCAPPTPDVWCVLDADDQAGRFEVGIGLSGDAPEEDGLCLRRPDATTFAIIPASLDPATARACAEHLAAWPVTPYGRIRADGALWLRLDPIAAAVTLWLPLRERRPFQPG
jgi:hypothetical protein